MSNEVPTTAWWHKLHSNLGLVLYRSTLEQDDRQTWDELKALRDDVDGFIETVGDRYVGGFPITLETMVAFAKAHGKLDDLRELLEAEL